jgi:B-box zinc finger
MPVSCARCSMPLPKRELLNGDSATCTSCGSRNTVRLFPAALAQSAAARPEAAQEGEAACFEHPGKRAVASCEQCGRFVCQLCSIEFGDGVWCPLCVANSSGKAKRANSDTARMLYDTWALVIPLALLVIWPLTILSAPAVVALAITKWRKPISLVRRNRWRFVLGLAVAVAQGGAWVLFIWYTMAKVRAGA